MILKSFRGLVAVAGLVLITTGCATTTDIRALQPAEVGAAASLKRVGVAPFNQQAKTNVSLDSKIEAELANYQLEQGVNYYNVVDRANLETIIKEQKLQLSGLTDSSQATKVGKLSGAQALVVGNVSSAGVEDSHYREGRVKYVNCDSKGKNCTKYEYTVSCTARTINLGAQVKLTDIERGNFITANNYNQKKTWKTCEDNSSSLPSKSHGLEVLADEIAAAFVFRLVPHYITFKVELYKKAEVKLEKLQEDQFKAGIEFIKAGRMDRAEDLFVQLMDATQARSFAVVYNYGVIKESEGKFEEAKRLYEVADKLTLSPEKNINAALVRINKIISDHKLANEQISRRIKR